MSGLAGVEVRRRSLRVLSELGVLVSEKSLGTSTINSTTVPRQLAHVRRLNDFAHKYPNR